MIKFATLALVIALAVCQNDAPNAVVTAVTISCVTGAPSEDGTATTETCGEDVTGCHSPAEKEDNEFTAYGCGPCPDGTDETCVGCEGADCNTYTLPLVSWQCANNGTLIKCSGTAIQCHGPPEAEDEEDASEDETEDTADDADDTADDADDTADDAENSGTNKRSIDKASVDLLLYGCHACAANATACETCDGDKCNGATAAAPLLAVLIGVLFWLQ